MEQQVSIVDDDAGVRDTLRVLLGAVGFNVKTYSSAKLFLADAGTDHDCLVADVRMPDMSGLELQEEIGRRGMELPLIIVTGHGDVPVAVKAMKAGAIDFIEKPFDDDTILRSVQRALEIGRHTRNKNAEVQAARNMVGLLTPREKNVLEQLVKGHSNKVTAYKLGISPRTVEIHRAHIMDKMNVRSLSDLVRISLAAQDAPRVA